MAMKRVFSSHINAVGYDSSSKELAVEFQNGKTAVYSDVPEDIAKMVVDAPSVGTALTQFVKGKFAFGYKPT
jgi:hypothetical protein